MAADLWDYSKLLAEQLRLNGMEEEQVQEVVAEVQHHVIATQQDPVKAFGQPTDYAMTWIAPKSRRWIVRIVAAAAGVTSLLALPMGLLWPESRAGQVEIDSSYILLWLIWVVGMGVLPWTVEVWLVRRRGRRAGGPAGVPIWALLIVTSLLATAAIWVGITWLTEEGEVVLSAPRWVVVLIGLVCLPGVAFMGSHRNAALPERPGTAVTWKTRVRRAFINR